MEDGLEKQKEKLNSFLNKAKSSKSNLLTKIMDKKKDLKEIGENKADKVREALDKKIGPMTTEDLVQITMKMMIGDQKSLESVVARLRAFPPELRNPVWDNIDDPFSLLLEQSN